MQNTENPFEDCIRLIRQAFTLAVLYVIFVFLWVAWYAFTFKEK